MDLRRGLILSAFSHHRKIDELARRLTGKGGPRESVSQAESSWSMAPYRKK